MSLPGRIAAGAAALLAALALALVASPAQAATTCSVKSIPVNVGVPAHISGTLCTPAGADTLQVLVPGATYTSLYWQFPGRSYTALANKAGYATFAMDRLDTGKSTQILPLLDTSNADATSIHQVISALHFPHTVLVGHSLGSLISVNYAARYHDIDGIVLTGMTTYVSAPFLAQVARGMLYPTALDPDPRLQNRPPGELTLSNADRAHYFYADDVPASVVNYDNAHKDAFTAAEFGDGIPASLASLPTILVRTPVLLVEGNHDAIFECADQHPCSTRAEVLRDERLSFASARSLDAAVITGSAHDLSLSQQHVAQANVISAWAAKTVS